MVSLDIIIVNWNAGPLLRTCLHALGIAGRQEIDLRRVMVVDNASTDGSCDDIDEPGLPLHLVRNTVNMGFAAACNLGAKGSDAQYLLFLNPDTRVERDSLEKLGHFLEHDLEPSTAVVGVPLTDENGNTLRTCSRFPGFLHLCSVSVGLCYVFPRLFPHHVMLDWDHGETREVDHVMGAFYLIRRVVFESVGGFDQRFFVYLEDLDLSLRVKLAGYRTMFFDGVRVYHRGGGTSEKVRATRLFYALRSRILYAYKHLTILPATVVLVATVLAEPVIRSVRALLRGSGLEFSEVWRAYARLWGNLPRLLAGNGGGGR